MSLPSRNPTPNLSRFYLRQPLTAVLLSVSPYLVVATLLVVATIPLNTFPAFFTDALFGLAALSALFGLRLFYARTARRIFIDSESVGITTKASGLLHFRVIPKANARKLIVTQGRILLLGPHSETLFDIPVACWTAPQLQDFTAAIPCRSNGVWTQAA